MSRKRSKRREPAAEDAKRPRILRRDSSMKHPPAERSIAERSVPASEIAASDDESARPPSSVIRMWLSFWVVFHLLAILISFTSVVDPSSVHLQLSNLVFPYLRPTHFAANDRPVYLTYGDSDDQPHRLQVTTDRITEQNPSDEVDWQDVGPGQGGGLAAYPGLAVSDRVARWLATAAMQADNEQPSMVAELLLPIVQSDSNVTAIRIVRYPTDLSDVTAEIETPYVARVVRSGESVSLVQLVERRLSAQPIEPDSTDTKDGADSDDADSESDSGGSRS